MPATQAEKVRENRLRRMAARQGLAVEKSRRRDPRARDYGTFWLRWVDALDPGNTHDAWVGYPHGFDIDQVEAFLLGTDIDPVVAAELERVEQREAGR